VNPALRSSSTQPFRALGPILLHDLLTLVRMLIFNTIKILTLRQYYIRVTGL